MIYLLVNMLMHLKAFIIKHNVTGSSWPSWSWGSKRRRLPPSPTWSRPTSGTWCVSTASNAFSIHSLSRTRPETPRRFLLQFLAFQVIFPRWVDQLLASTTAKSSHRWDWTWWTTPWKSKGFCPVMKIRGRNGTNNTICRIKMTLFQNVDFPH